MVLVLCEMQSVRSRIWIRVAVSISCDDNHYTTGMIMNIMNIFMNIMSISHIRVMGILQY